MIRIPHVSSIGIGIGMSIGKNIGIGISVAIHSDRANVGDDWGMTYHPFCRGKSIGWKEQWRV